MSCLCRRPGTTPTVRGTVVVNHNHVSDANMGFELPTPLLWWLPRGGSRCPPPPLSPRSSSIQCGNGPTTTRAVPCPVLGLVVLCLCRCCGRRQRGQQSCPPKSHNPPSDDAFATRPLPAQKRTTNEKAKMMTAADGVWAACTSDGVIALRRAMG